MKGDFAAGIARGGAELDESIGGTEEFFFVLDGDDAVAARGEAANGIDEAGDVLRMEADGGLVEDVEHVDEAAAEDGCELHALGFAAAERAHRAVEREIAEADFEEEAEAGANVCYQRVGEAAIVVGEFERREETVRVVDREGGELCDVVAADLPGEGFFVQAGAVAGGAGLLADGAEAFARGAGAQGTVEAEEAGIGIGEEAVAGGAFEAGGEFEAVIRLVVDDCWSGGFRAAID